MSNTESRVDPGSLVIRTDRSSHVVSPHTGVATIGRDAQAVVQIDDPRISRVHVRIEFVDNGWHVVDTSMNGVFVNGARTSALPVAPGLMLRLGDPDVGPAVRFELIPMSAPMSAYENDLDVTTLVPPDDDDSTTVQDPGMVRAGAAAAARRRELDISQRSLAADGIINAGALIAFEKGRSWPRDKTRARLEEVLRWAPGTITQIRDGGPVGVEETTELLPRDGGGDEGSLIAQAVVTAVNTLGGSMETLPPVDDPDFTRRVTAILADLRQLEAVATRAARIGRVTPPLIKALSTVRRRMEELTVLAATSPGATLGQRLYAARRNANLTILETAQAAGVDEQTVIRAEAEDPISAVAVAAIEALIEQLDWR